MLAYIRFVTNACTIFECALIKKKLIINVKCDFVKFQNQVLFVILVNQKSKKRDNFIPNVEW